MKTAVEYLADELKKNHGIDLRLYDEFEKAKEMEKEQIIKSFEIGYENGACVQEGSAIYHGGNYYNETFKS